MALSHPSGTSSSWLKAIPRACLGLAIPRPELTHIVRCFIVSTIPSVMRIHQYNALVNVIYNALSQDHPGVLKEQRASHDNGSCSDDIFTLIFNMVGLLSLTSLCAVPLSLPSFLHQLLVVGWLLLLERLPRTRNIWQLWRRLDLILFSW